MVQLLFSSKGSGWNNLKEDEGTPVGKGSECQLEEKGLRLVGSWVGRVCRRDQIGLVAR